MCKILEKSTTSTFRVEHSAFSSLISKSFILKKGPACSYDTLLQFTYPKIGPITGSRCQKGSMKLRFPDYVTMAKDSGKVVSLKHRPLLPPFLLGVESTPEP